MVMHARKIPRLNDGYFDRNQAHPYENMGKYTSKSGCSERYNDKMRNSPTNGSSYGRSESPDSWHSPRYHNKSSYSQRLKERERERHERGNSKSPPHKERSCKNNTGGASGGGGTGSTNTTSKDHHPATTSSTASSSSSSSSRRTSEISTSGAHRSNHDRAQTEVQDKEKDKRLQVGDWSEHISSSGKKYYYNCKTEVSQWEKPKEWIEWEKQQGIHRSSESSRSKDKSHERQSTSIGSKPSDKHSSGTEKSSRSHQQQIQHRQSSRSHGERHSHQSASTPTTTSGKLVNTVPTSSSNRNNASRSQQHRGEERSGEKADAQITGDKREGNKRTENRKGSEDSQTQDMDISPESSGTPTSSQTDSRPQSRNQTPVLSSATTQSQSHMQCPATPQQQQQQHTQSHATSGPHTQPQLLSPSQVTVANLPKLISQLAGTKGLPNLSELSPQEALRTIQQALQLTKQVTSLAQTVGGLSRSPHAPPVTSDALAQKSMSPLPNPSQPLHAPFVASSHPGSTSHLQSQLSLSSSQHTLQLQQQQPQPQSHTVDGRVDLEKGRLSPASDYSTHSSRHDSPTSSVSSLHSLSGTGPSSLATAVLKPSVPSLTPSLANYFREDLISHVTGWQADHAERQGVSISVCSLKKARLAIRPFLLQASRYSEEAHNIGSLNCTRVSAELKMARSHVRLAEIQATLQEQRILFLRQQIKGLEDWRSMNSFMSNS